MEDKLDIFICTNKDFEPCPSNKAYKIVSTEDFEAKSGLEHIICDPNNDKLLCKEHAYSELARFHYVAKNYPLKDYVGTAHYRRYFEFFNNIPDLDEIFKTHDAILPHGLSLEIFDTNSVYAQYAQNHNAKDLDLIVKIINLYYPEYFHSALEVLSGKLFYPCNIFVMKKEMFVSWCNFVFGVLNIFDVINNFSDDNDILRHVERHISDYHNVNAEYQSRIEAFLSERLSTIFMVKNIKKPYLQDIILTESHYDFEKVMFTYNPQP